MILLAAYYGAATHLPASNKRYTRWCRLIRRGVTKRLFNSAGSGINIERGAFFGSGAKVSIGDNSGIGIDCNLLGEVSLGNNVMMGPEVVFLATSHDHSRTDVPMIRQGFAQEKPIVVGNDVWIGMRCTILPGVKVGNWVIIGACSVVTKSIPDYAVVAGNPARVINYRGASVKVV